MAGNLTNPSQGQDATTSTGRGGLFLHGTALDSARTGVPDVALTLTDANGRQVDRARTNADGGYRFGLARGGTYVLIASAGHYQPTASMVVLGDQPVQHDVQMFGAGGLTGVVHAAGQPVPDATVVVTDVRGEVITAGASGTDGRYRFTDLVGGSYAMTVTVAGYRPVAMSVAVVDGEQTVIDVPLQSGSRLSGIVRSVNLGQPIPEARVTVLDGNGSVIAASTTENDGGYTFTDLPDGEYTVIATGYPPAASSLQLSGEHTEHDVELGYRAANES